MTLEQAVAQVTSTNSAFATTTADIRGVTYPVFANAPPHLRAMMQVSQKAHGNGTAEYMVFQGERWSYNEYCNETNKLSHVLQQKIKVHPGDCVAIAMANCPEMAMLVMAISSIGGVVVFLNGWWTSEELDYALGDTGTRLVFADGARMDRLLSIAKHEQLQLVGVRDGEGKGALDYSVLRDGMDDISWPEVDIDPDQDFAIMYSSGTSSDPKGVVLTHRGAITAVYSWAMQPALASLLDPPPVDAPPAPRISAMVATPLFHVTALHALFLLSMPAGAKLTLLRKWNVDEAVRLIDSEKITRFVGVPTQCADLIEAADRMGTGLNSLDYISSGGAKRPPVQVAQLAQHFPKAKIATGWGMTETNALGIGMIGPDYIARPNGAGRPYPPVQQFRFLDDDGQDVPIGETGEITVKSASNMRCYHNNPEETAEVLQGGWLRTGDLGKIDPDGFITIVDRKKNIIIRGGENISCLDVEAALHHHPAIAEACVFALPDDRLGEVVGAAVQTRPGMRATQEEVLTFLSEHIARFKLPVRIWFQTNPLSRAATDKFDRRGIRGACLSTWK